MAAWPHHTWALHAYCTSPARLPGKTPRLLPGYSPAVADALPALWLHSRAVRLHARGTSGTCSPNPELSSHLLPVPTPRARSISSTYWIWRSYIKTNRDVDAPVWGFELAHNDGPHEALDAEMTATLQEGYAVVARANAGNTVPCGLDAALAPPVTNVTAAPRTLANKAHQLGLPLGTPVELPPLGVYGVECDPNRLEDRIDWTVLRFSATWRMNSLAHADGSAEASPTAAAAAASEQPDEPRSSSQLPPHSPLPPPTREPPPPSPLSPQTMRIHAASSTDVATNDEYRGRGSTGGQYETAVGTAASTQQLLSIRHLPPPAPLSLTVLQRGSDRVSTALTWTVTASWTLFVAAALAAGCAVVLCTLRQNRAGLQQLPRKLRGRLAQLIEGMQARETATQAAAPPRVTRRPGPMPMARAAASGAQGRGRYERALAVAPDDDVGQDCDADVIDCDLVTRPDDDEADDEIDEHLYRQRVLQMD